MITEYIKEVPSRYLESPNHENNALFKSPYGNTIFAITTFIVFLFLTVFVFQNENMFINRELYCKVCNTFCWPCPQPCLSPQMSSTNSSSSDVNQPEETEVLNGEPIIDENAKDTDPHTVVYYYRKEGESKLWFAGKPKKDEHIPIQVVEIG